MFWERFEIMEPNQLKGSDIMTDHEMLELLVQKVTGIDHKVTGLEEKVTGIDHKVTGLEEKVTGIDHKVTGLEQDIKLIKTQQSEHGEMIRSLIHAGETQKAQHDSLQMEVAKLSGEMRQGFAEITEVQKSLVEMYGEHEVEIRALRRRPV
jgi:predicted  nucleic acid-binding Zn-ribbon protein